jgi:hypothetical protein
VIAPSIESIAFDAFGLGIRPDQTTGNDRAWFKGDKRELVSLHRFDKSPDIPVPLDQLDALRAFYRKLGTDQV